MLPPRYYALLVLAIALTWLLAGTLLRGHLLVSAAVGLALGVGAAWVACWHYERSKR